METIMKKHVLNLLLVLLLGCGVAFGQGSQVARPIPHITSLPATCTTSDKAILISGGTATDYICSTTNTWTSSGAGTVTSVALTAPSWLSVANSPVTSSGTLAITATGAQTAGRVLGTPAGATGAVDLVQIANGHVAASAAIDYSKLSLTGSILNADISNSAAIAYSKLNLTGAVLNADLAGSIAYGKLTLTDSILNADINSAAAIAYSKLNLTGAILNDDLAGSIANAKLANSTISIAGNSTALGASVTLDAITGLSTTGLVKRTGANALGIGVAGTDYAAPGAVTGSGITMATNRLLGRTTASSGAVEEITPAATFSFSSGALDVAPSGITNAMLAGSIAYSKLTLTGAILDADLAGSIAISKLAITGTPDGTKYLRDDGSWQVALTAPGGSGSELQYRAGATSFGALTGSSVSGANLTLGGTLASGAQTITSVANPCWQVGPNGATNPTLAVKCDVASQETGVLVTGAAAGGGVTIGATSSGSNEGIIYVPKGAAGHTFRFGNVSVNDVLTINSSGTITLATNAGGAKHQLATDASHRMSSDGGIFFNSATNLGAGALDSSIVRSAAGVLRIGNASTGAGSLLVGASTDTADAQLSVYSQNTLRPGLKLNMPSGTAATQEAFGNYNNGTRTAYITADGTITVNDGAVGRPSVNFSGDTAMGIFRAGTGRFAFANTGKTFMALESSPNLYLGSDVPIAWSTGSWSAGTFAYSGDLFLLKDAANTLAQKNGDADQIARSYGANSGYWERGSISESITLSTGGATTDSTADLLPANAIIEAVTARITTAITTATDWALGDATTVARFAAANSTLAAGTTSVGLEHVDQTGAAGPKQTSAAKLRITTTGTPGAGVIRVTVYYRRFVAPTS